MDLMKMDVLRCDGRTAESVRRLGDVPGHVGPGFALGLWALHMFISASWRNALAERDPSAPPFFSRTWEPILPFIPWARWQRLNRLVPLDPLFKAIVSLLMVTIAFPYQRIICDDGVRYGRVVGQHIMRWAHSTLISSYTVLGCTELAALRARYPPGTTHAGLVLVHAVCVVIFLYHQKHEILDQMAHGLVGYSFLCAVFCGVMEIFQPASFIAFAAKIYFHILGSLWLGVTGYIIFGDSVFWSPVFDGQPDVSPAIFVAVLFGIVMLGLFVFLLLLYTAIDLLAAWRLQSRGTLPGRGAAGASELGMGMGMGAAEGIPLSHMGGIGRKAAGSEESEGLLPHGSDLGGPGGVQYAVNGVLGGGGGVGAGPGGAGASGGYLESFGVERRNGAAAHGARY